MAKEQGAQPKDTLKQNFEITKFDPLTITMLIYEQASKQTKSRGMTSIRAARTPK